MGVQSQPFPLRVRQAPMPEPHHHVEQKVVKLCQRQLQEALLHPLPLPVQQLKVKILGSSHPIKTSRFSLSHMKRVAIPPVEVPRDLCGARVMRATVGGKRVPFSRDMWENRKRKANARRLDMIHENLVF
ncbi:hypothetical protein Poli38472_008428 [Pythium oligandrum]|uniref:Uncharacterized protein n=1 Tax=Pythium oligandrum TaxID=41045 RepID=A0A8K1CNC4_PYTOL|nr:hypothetical protein Poli38472_008428 [Pythium oligandrum]|eukprot:TMW65786.1 hypothetical protein Poli38472_008428 [Pythium oligandrum]